MTINEDTINQILESYDSFTKEEYEILNTFETKQSAKYNKEKFKKIAQTDSQFFVRRVYIDKYIDKALQHKELVLKTYLEHLNAHKEIMLQLLSILQSLTQNPNLLDTILQLFDSEWYGGQDLKHFLGNLITQESNYITQLWSDLLDLTNLPALCFLPELFENTPASIKDANTIIPQQLNEMFRNNYPLEP